MTDREALERAVILSPLDDLPRLVFADWLDENGEGERAEFIRKSILAARNDMENGWVLQPHVHHHKKELFRFRGLRVGPGQYTYSRGFPSRVTLSDLAAYERHAVEIVSRAPVTEIVVADREPRNMRSSFRWTGARDDYLSLEPHHVPFRIIDKMNTPGEYLMGSNRLTRDQAITTLARAFADEARHQANLPPVWCGALAGGER